MVIPYIITAASLCGFLLLWFVTVRRELSSKRGQVQNSAEEVALHEAALKELRDSVRRASAETALDTAGMIYREVVFRYNRALKNPLNYVPGIIMGFRFFAEQKDNKR
jgi:cyanate lyase